MKKFKFIVILSFMICLICAIFTGCKGDRIETPTGFSVDENNTLTWTEVENARSYLINITDSEDGANTENTTRKTSYSLSKLEEGDYEIKVKAVAAGNELEDSAWSEIFYFHKDYETGCIYTLINNNTEYEITKVGAASGSITIEDTYRGKPVTRIADAAFKNSGRIENVVIGKNVVYIGEDAFYNCPKLTSVTLPAGLQTLGAAAFHTCRALTSIVIPDGLEQLNEQMFSNCRSLAEVKLGSGLKFIGDYAFSNCSALSSIEIPDSVQTIGAHAFASSYTYDEKTDTATGLTSVKLGENVETIGEYAFYLCERLGEIEFGESGKLVSIGKYAFAECNQLASVDLPEGLTDLAEGVFYLARGLESVTLPDTIAHISDHAFVGTKFYDDALAAGDSFIYAGNWLVGCSAETKATITSLTADMLQSGVVGIADSVFNDCENLASVTLPDTVKILGNYSFYDNDNLSTFKSYTTQNGLEYIGDYAFAFSERLSVLTLGKGIKTIGNYAFRDCAMVQNNELNPSATLPDTVTSIGTYAFLNTALWNNAQDVVYAGNWVVGVKDEEVTEVTLKPSTVGVANWAFYQCSSLRSVVGLDYAKYIGYAAFYDCSALTQIQLNSSLKRIEDFTFYKCSSLFSVEFPMLLEYVGRSAFYKCETLDEVNLSESKVQTVGDYAFYNCFNIKELDLGDSLKTVGNYAFYKCSSVKDVTLPDTVETLGDRAFYKCEGLETLKLSNNVTAIGDYAFNGCIALKEVNIPDSVKSIGENAFRNCESVTSLKLGANVESIGNYAFYGMENLERLVLPTSVKKIGNYAFKGCNGLISLVISGNVTSIGAHALYGCKSMTIYTDVAATPEGWSPRWNSSRRPVVFGCTLSEDKSYVVSLTVNENTFEYENAINGLSQPERDGYTFVGWATSADATEAEYTARELTTVPAGTTVYAIWTEAVEELPEELPEGGEDETQDPIAA